MKTFLSSFFLLNCIVSAQNPTLDARLEKIDIYLHTVDVGNLVFNNFGHTAVRVHDQMSGQDLVYNWGIFDFSDPVSFSLRFYQGDLLYKLGVYPYENAIRHYEYEKRTVWEDKLNLTPEQKSIFLQKLEWNYRPENRQYQYQYFFNNCSTIVRDYFDLAMNGAIADKLSDEKTDIKYRDVVRSAYATNPEIQLPLDILMNSDIDRKMSVWEEMFLPMKLREHLLKFESNGQKFISESKILTEHPEMIPYKLNSFQMLAALMLILNGALIISIKKEKLFLERILWVPCLLISLFIGILGAMLLLNWIFSGHTDLHHNANLWLIWPIDLLLPFIIFRILWGGKGFALSNTSKSNWLIYVKAHWLVFPLTAILWLTDIISQNISWILLYFMPVLCLSLFAIQLKIKNCEVKV